MLRKKPWIRIIASFLLINFILTTFTPSVSLALTGGPSSPEFSSFEPVDTTDMVDLSSGDFTYNSPVLEVPGPAGGYPISLSYHAGISPDQESSWIGLGWNINPGAINRSVNVFPDDNYLSNVKVKDYWGGGTTTEKTRYLGLSSSTAGMSSMYTKTERNDTYKGFSSSWAFRQNFNFASAVEGYFKTRPGQTPNPGVVETKRVGGDRAGGFIKSLINYNTGWTISSTGGGVKTFGNWSGDLIKQHKSPKSGRISTLTTSEELSRGVFPIGKELMLSWGKNKRYHRYWMDQTDDLTTFGSLFGKKSNEYIGEDGHYNNLNVFYSYDAYSMLDYTYFNSLEEHDPEKQLGGSFPAFDSYQVLGQGIAGVMKPYIFENGNIYKQSVYDKDYLGIFPDLSKPLLSYKKIHDFQKDKVNFRFLNDFANSLSLEGQVKPITHNRQDFVTSAQSPLYEEGSYNPETQHLEGSKHIEWYTNDEILNLSAKTQGFMDYYSNEGTDIRQEVFELTEDYLQPEMGLPTECGNESMFTTGASSFIEDTYLESDPNHQGKCATYNLTYKHTFKPTEIYLGKKIGGFKITNESGVTYHYALPVYASNEYTRTKLKNPRKGAVQFKESKNPEPYAYSWLLTGVTGPDFVDNNKNGRIDDGDKGYWVKFDYGKWTDSYQWRSPHTGYDSDLEDNYATFSYGIKELYYLDAIETASHKAIFIKSIRKDGKGVTSRLEGGSKPRNFKLNYQINNQNPGDIKGSLSYSVSPVSTLKLDKIMLFNKEDLNRVTLAKNSGSLYNEAPIDNPHKYMYVGFDNYPVFTAYNSPEWQQRNIKLGDYLKVKYHNGNLVYDNADNIDEELERKVLRVVKFEQDYSLCKSTPNSFEKNHPTFIFNGYCNCGLTYAELEQYFYKKDFFGANITVRDVTNNSGFDYCDGGDFKYLTTGKLTLLSVQTLGRGGIEVIPKTSFNYSINPAYSNKEDIWGYYKEDFDLSDPNFTQKTSEASSKLTSAWSLTSIQLPTGALINIAYESDSYSKSEMLKTTPLLIKSITKDATNYCKVVFTENGLDLSKFFTVNKSITLKALFSRKLNDDIDYTIADNNIGDIFCRGIGSNYILVENSTLYNYASFGPYFSSGFVLSTPQTNRVGGGIRVKSIEIKDSFTQESYKTHYDYNHPNTEVSSGVTSFEHYSLPSIKFNENIDVFDPYSDKYRKDQIKNASYNFLSVVYNTFGELVALSREIPGPGVLYQYVTVSYEGNGEMLPGKEVYQYEPFNRSMVSRYSDDIVDLPNHKSRLIKLRNFTSRVGVLKSAIKYDKYGNIVAETRNEYLHDKRDDQDYITELNAKFFNQGMVHQAFNEYKILRRANDTYYNKALVSVKEEYPTILTRSTSIDNKKGMVVSTENKSFNYFTGQPTEVITRDGFGNKYLTKAVPAFELKRLDGLNAYPEMGLMVKDPGKNKHMLIQEGKNLVYKLADDGTYLGLVSASAQTWNNIWTYRGILNGLDYVDYAVSDDQQKIWRKSQSYFWNAPSLLEDGSGLGVAEDLVELNWSAPSSSSINWIKTKEITRYDWNSKVLEEKDINDNYFSVKRDHLNSLVIATSSNSRYGEMAFSGAEESIDIEYLEGEVKRNDGSIKKGIFHTGTSSLGVPANGEGFSFSLKNEGTYSKSFRSSVWVYSPNGTIPNARLAYTVGTNAPGTSSPVISRKAGDWFLIGITTPPISPNSSLTVSCENLSNEIVFFDDFRVHPNNASMSTYVYDKSTLDLTYILDNNNLFSQFEYDRLGRLKTTFKESFEHGVRRVNDYIINYAEVQSTPTDFNPKWESTGQLKCELNATNNNTGIQLKEEIDKNVNSITYNTKRWVSNGVNTTACSTCYGFDKKLIGTECVTSTDKRCLYCSTEPQPGESGYYCNFQYYFYQDNSYGPPFAEIAGQRCPN